MRDEVRGWWVRGSIAAILIIGALGALGIFYLPFNHDVAWLLYAAQRALGGADLYVDVIEVNPPLIVWLSMAPVALASVGDISTLLATRFLVIGLVVAVLLLANLMLRTGFPEVSRVFRGTLLAFVAFALLPLVGYDFGQREHLLFILLLPYFFAASAYGLSEEAFGRRMRGLVGVLAGIGIALKPHFVLIWIVLEAHTIARCGIKSAVRIENVLIGSILLAHFIAILLITPEYLVIVDWAREVYGGFQGREFLELIQNPVVLWTFIAVILFLLSRQETEWKRLGQVFALAAVALVSVALWQGKGFSYHWYPALAASFLLIGLTALGVLSRVTHPAANPGVLIRYAPSLISAILVMVAAATAVSAAAGGTQNNPFLEELSPVVEAHSGGGPIYIMSYAVRASFPLVNEAGIGWASRFNSLWLLAGLYAEEESADTPFPAQSRRGEIQDYLVDAIVADMIRERPSLIMVESTPGIPALRETGYLDFFSRDPRFREAFSSYEFLFSTARFDVYRRPESNLDGSTAVSECCTRGRKSQASVGRKAREPYSASTERIAGRPLLFPDGPIFTGYEFAS